MSTTDRNTSSSSFSNSSAGYFFKFYLFLIVFNLNLVLEPHTKLERKKIIFGGIEVNGEVTSETACRMVHEMSCGIKGKIEREKETEKRAFLPRHFRRCIQYCGHSYMEEGS